MKHLEHFFIAIKECNSIDCGGVIKDFVDKYRSVFCAEFWKEHPNISLLRDGFYYLNTTPFEDEDNEAAIEFVCGCNYFILMTFSRFTIDCRPPAKSKQLHQRYPWLSILLNGPMKNLYLLFYGL